MYKFLKPFIFQFSPETAHHITMRLLRWATWLPFGKWFLQRQFVVHHPKLERTVMGLRFPNPVGLAAGFDKDGKYFSDLTHLGFGFIEIGTVTPRPQDGNPKPRLFRLPEYDALINRMGFNNEGVNAMAERLRQVSSSEAQNTEGGAVSSFEFRVSSSEQLKTQNSKPKTVIGGNIGKNKNTPNEAAERDYEICFEALFPYVDYFVVNVSSPNTPDLRALQDKEPLTRLLALLQKRNYEKPQPKPILLKIAPDLNDSQLDDILDIVQSQNLAGIVATNTTIDKKSVADHPLSKEAGGLSGRPLTQRSTDIIRYLRQKAKPDLVIIGVGGIYSAADALEKLAAGADLVQVYSGLVYEGPSLIRRINEGILNQNE
jgi:dihydroorotate dehydrogenase